MKHTLQVRCSKIHGNGLFATRSFNAGALLGLCETVPATTQGPYTLSTDEGDLRVICRFRFINHSAEPNVAYYDDLTVVALRPIQVGDELTHDYGMNW